MEGQVFDIPVEHIANLMKSYGNNTERLDACVEECSELIVALEKQHRYSRHPDFSMLPSQIRFNVVEELTQVAMCLGMLKEIFNISQEEIELEVHKRAVKNNCDDSNYSYQTEVMRGR